MPQCPRILAAFTPTPVDRPSHLILATLLLILGACVWVFVELVRRETRQRKAVALARWARSRGLRVHIGHADLPDLLALKPLNPIIQTAIAGDTLTLARVETAEAGLTDAVASQRNWNLLLRKLPAQWPTTALRPTAHANSAIDLFSLSSYPSLMPTERFVIFGSEARAAHRLADSPAPTLLPADIGLILTGDHLILDFSGRPFDEIEFDRLIDLAQQLAPRLSIQ